MLASLAPLLHSDGTAVPQGFPHTSSGAPRGADALLGSEGPRPPKFIHCTWTPEPQWEGRGLWEGPGPKSAGEA